MSYFKLLFRSLISRMLLLTMVSVVVAQTISSFFWVSQFTENEKNQLFLMLSI
ncbi:hypothetical protein ACLKMH_12370 [Psychromonas sp. KJ10-10]|uniref:hypothetical protein n=1 Tax=Psychromonas sp. KJ10-10 TaxID=3391823 RepID=UPI0039B64B69